MARALTLALVEVVQPTFTGAPEGAPLDQGGFQALLAAAFDDGPAGQRR
jgi:hypothetical protein